MKRGFFCVAVILVYAVCIQAQEKKYSDFGTLNKQANKLLEESKSSEYIQLMDYALKEFPQRRIDILQHKLDGMEKLEMNKEALPVAEEIFNLVPESGKKVLNAAMLSWRHMYCKDLESAYKWAKISADLGYQKYGFFQKDDVFKPLREDKRFDSLIAQIKKNAGIGNRIESFSFKDVTGKQIDSKKYLGKVLLVDFWATWCPPCIEEFPNMQKVLNEFGKDGFEIIGVSYDTRRDQLDRFLEKNNLPWPTLCEGKGSEEDAMGKLFKVALLPSCYLIDRKGIIRHVQIRGDGLRNAVEELIKE